MTVYYFSHAHNQSGYGRAARDYIAALAPYFEVSSLPLVSAGAEFAGEIVVHHGSPAQLEALSGGLHASSLNVAVTAWEMQNFPEEFGRALDLYDLVLVPSAFTASAVGQAMSGSSAYDLPTLKVLPHCFDPMEWPHCPKGESDGVFTFYTLEAWGERKNVLGVLRAYLHAFSKTDRTRLVLVSADADFDVIRATIARSMIPADELPGLLVPDRALSDEEVRALHRDGDCYVSATRGEGFGLGMFEAAITGRPVIAPDLGGHVEFLELIGDYWESYSCGTTPCFAGEGTILKGDGVVGQNVRLPRGASAKMLWGDPSLSELAEAMRSVRSNYGYYRDEAEHGRKTLVAKYGCGPVGERFSVLLQTARIAKFGHKEER